MRNYSFESLDAWTDARELVKWVYTITKNFPSAERYGLISQVRRASVSIVSNLAEGSSRKSPRDQAHFSQIAYSSLLEVLNQLIISVDLNFMNENQLIQGRTMIESLTLKVGALRNYQLNRIT